MKMKSSYKEVLQAILYANSCAMRLKLRLDNPMAKINDESVSNYDLAQSMVNCFSNAISILSDKPKSKDDQFSDLSSRDYSPPLLLRSHTKKRKINSENSIKSWRDDSPNPIYYDGFLWRKYGQKSIKSSNHQRSYYRCAYNVDLNCGARKYVQKIKDNPPVYRTTYFGHHTCKINHNQNEIFTDILDPVDDSNNAEMIQFGEGLNTKKESHLGGFSFSVKKEETMDQCHEKTGNDQECEHLLDENLSSLGSYTHPLSSDCESIAFDSELLLDNSDLWDCYDQFGFGLL